MLTDKAAAVTNIHNKSISLSMKLHSFNNYN